MCKASSHLRPCAAAGHPIVGDATYTDDFQSSRMMLHAWSLHMPSFPRVQKQPIGLVGYEGIDAKFVAEDPLPLL